jgi:hypothetical protein
MLKCPRCKTTSLRFTEFATIRMTFHQCSKKGAIRVFGDECIQPLSRVACICDKCHHRWTSSVHFVEKDDDTQPMETCKHHWGTDAEATLRTLQ